MFLNVLVAVLEDHLGVEAGARAARMLRGRAPVRARCPIRSRRVIPAGARLLCLSRNPFILFPRAAFGFSPSSLRGHTETPRVASARRG